MICLMFDSVGVSINGVLFSSGFAILLFKLYLCANRFDIFFLFVLSR